MILRCFENGKMMTVAEDDEANLFAVEKFLDDEARAKRGDGSFGFAARLGNDDAFPGGEPVGLDHQGIIEFRQSGAGFLEGFGAQESRGGNAQVLHQLFGVDFACLELGELAGGSDDEEIGGAELIDDAGGEGGFGSDDDQIGPDRLCGFEEIEMDGAAELLDPRIAWIGEDGMAFARKAPGEGVFPATAADDHDFHIESASLPRQARMKEK